MTYMFIIIVSFCFFYYKGHDYPFDIKQEMIKTTDGSLSMYIHTPKTEEKEGMIIFIHGDGPQDGTQGNSFQPVIERFAKQGYTSVTWDKLGVGDSTGNWLKQTMDDRVVEVIEVIDWLKENYPNETKTIALWGVSQAGWVIPRVTLETKIDFSMLVVPAINWMKQDLYCTELEVRKKGGTNKEVDEAKNKLLQDYEVMRANESYESYLRSGGQELVEKDRYQFLRGNMDEDITPYLSKIDSKLYVVLAEKDKNVNSVESEQVYKSLVPSDFLDLKVIPNVVHQMTNPLLVKSPMLKKIVKVIVPRYFLLDNNYLNHCEEIVRQEKGRL